MSSFRLLSPGEPAPWFTQRCTSNDKYVFDTAGGRYIVLCFFGTAKDAGGQEMLGFARAHRRLFDDALVSFFGVSADPEDLHSGRVQADLPGIRHFWDFDGLASRLYGALPWEAEPERRLRRVWIVLDPGLNVLANIPYAGDGSDQRALLALLQNLWPVPRYAGVEMHAPIAIVPNLFEPELCRRLMDYYGQFGGQASGFMRDVDGKTVYLDDPEHKRRQDALVEDQELLSVLHTRVKQKVRPLVKKAFNFEVTRIERFLVGCYDSSWQGHFRQHRDSTTRGTAHRRFALSVNLNDDFDGGELSFPEYGPRSYKVPAGSAIIFSGALLHAVSAVTRGSRYAFLPFLYDEAAAALRERNNEFLGEGVDKYTA